MRIFLALSFAVLTILSGDAGTRRAAAIGREGRTPPPIQERMAVPDDFPRFLGTGHDLELDALRTMFWEHFVPEGPYWDDWLDGGPDRNPAYPAMPSGPKATLWDEWLCGLMLWPAIETRQIRERMRERWGRKLSARTIDAEGYVDTDQGIYHAHPLGWPFPVWSDGDGGYGWHFSYEGTPGWYRPRSRSTPDDWTWEGVEDKGIGTWGWDLEVAGPDASLTTPVHRIDAFQAPFVVIRWKVAGLEDAPCALEWKGRGDSGFDASRRILFDCRGGGPVVTTLIPAYKHPLWKDAIVQLRVSLAGLKRPVRLSLQALFTTYDTRHNINNMNFVRGCVIYFWQTGDVDFLKRNIDRMRRALSFCFDQFHTREEKLVLTTWTGHDGLGCRRNPDGSISGRPGHGIGNNWWDILPFGHKDFYATVQFYDALNVMAALERDVRAHPEWRVDGTAPAFDPAELERHAAEVKARGNDVFWNPATGRFVACIDAEGQAHDYGYVSPNLEAVHFGFASPEHAAEIMSWVDGRRRVDGDTAQGKDIYAWRFAPRTTTRDNRDWWTWPGCGAGDANPWGRSIQNGGCVLGFSYYDLMARLKTYGPDDAWGRLREIARWFMDVQKAGGYQAFYRDQGALQGALQGANVPGALGITSEFWESAMVPQVVLNGFLGFKPTADGFRVEPRLPAAWTGLTVTRIRLRELVLSISAVGNALDIRTEGRASGPWLLGLPAGDWVVRTLDDSGRWGRLRPLKKDGRSGGYTIDWRTSPAVRLERAADRSGVLSGR